MRLRTAKQAEEFPSDEEWVEYFGGEHLSYFEELSPEEMKEWERDWKAASVEQRHRDMSLWPHWDFGSFLDALKNGEFLLEGLQCTDAKTRLLFEPAAYPFGGTDCLIAAIEAFGQEVVGVDDGTGYRQHVKQDRWQPSSRRKIN